MFASHMRLIVMHKSSGSRVRTRIIKSAAALMLSAGVFGIAADLSVAGPLEAGVWYDDTGKGAVQIEICGGNKLCGRIVWLREPLNAQGEPLTDKNNPKAENRDRPICGLPILGQLAAVPEGGYDGGWIYDPKVGKAYDVAITLVAPDKLQVTGYKGVKFLGKSFIWTRAEEGLEPCAAAPTDADAAGKQSAKQPAAKKQTTKAASGEALPWANSGATKQKAAADVKPKPPAPQPAKPRQTAE